MADTVRRWFERLLARIGRRPPMRRDPGGSERSDKIYPLW